MNLRSASFHSLPTQRGAALGGALLALALLCHAVPASASAGGSVPPQPSATLDSGCSQTVGTRQSLARIAQELKAQGMALEAMCQPGQPGWMVRVRVVDGVRAAPFVRGPLADGHEVDMGTPAGAASARAQAHAAGFSPDVHHNRQWLRSLMARHQFDNLPRAWWLFAARGAARAGVSDVASR